MSLSKGGGSSSVGGSRLVIVSGCGAVVVGAGSLLVARGCRLEAVGLLRVGGLLVGAGLWFMGAVVTSSAVWSALARLEGTRLGVLTIDDSIINDKRRHRRCSSFGCHVTLGDVAPANRPCCELCGQWLARADGRSAFTQHGEQRQTTTSSSFIVWLPRRSQRRGTCIPPHPSPSLVTWRWSFAVVVVFGVWMVGDGR